MKDNRTIVIVLFVVAFVIGAVFIFVGWGKSNSYEVVSVSDSGENSNLASKEQPAADESAPTIIKAESTTAAPKPKEGLEATDPETVVLASGDLLFVEAFDF